MTLIKTQQRPFDLFVNEFFGNNYNLLSNIKTNVQENDIKYQLDLVLPGFKKSDIDINIENNILIIKSVVEENDKNSYFKKSFERTFELPNDVDMNNIEAKMEDGILSISLNKNKEVLNTKKIVIN